MSEEVGPGERKAMQREGNLIEEIVEYSNMFESFNNVLRGTKRKKTRQGRFFQFHKKEIITDLSKKIADGTFRIQNYRERDIKEGGKIRRIQIISMYDRIGVHAIMNVVDRHIRKRLIRTTAASIKNRGIHDLLNYIKDDIKKDPTGTRFCYKMDIHHFYQSVDQSLVMRCYRGIFKDKILISLLDSFVGMMPSGISIGLRSSQSMGNLLLSAFLDHYMKDKCGVKYFYRYCDDVVVLGDTKQYLWNIRDKIHGQIQKAKLQIKPNERIYHTDEGIDFLGYVIFPTYVMLRKRNKKKAARKLHAIKSKRRRKELIASFYGMTKHADCNNLFKILTHKEMKSFKDLNVVYKPEDGKKRFPGTVMSIRELVNLNIVIKDFEVGIKTEQGADRCIVYFELNGEPKKFFTNSEEMKNILQQINELPDGFPFETTIKTEAFGKGRTKYVFT